jgi:anti-sigma B factor antagonist
MEVAVSIEGSTVKVSIKGSIDIDGAPELAHRLSEVIGNEEIKAAIFDLSEVRSITSSGIGKLLSFYKLFDKRGGSMKIKGISEELESQFREIHLDLILPIER